MTLSMLVGAAVAMRGNLVSIAVLSLIGGNLAPMLLRGHQDQAGGFLTYLLMLQIVALVLAWWGGSKKWWMLRGVSFAGTCLWTMGLLATHRFEPTDSPLWFSLLFAVLYQAELILPAMRKKRLETSRHDSLDAKTGLQFSILVTAAVTLATLFLFRESSDGIRATWVLGFAGITAVLSLLLSRASAKSLAMEHLSIGFAVQAAALLALAVPVALSGIWIAAGWGIMALAFAVTGMLFDLRIARISAVVTCSAGDCRFGFVDDELSGSWRASEIWLTIAGHGIPAYAVMSWLLAITGHVVASLLKRGVGEKDSSKEKSLASSLELVRRSFRCG